MQGVDPETLQQALAKQGQALKIYNFGINGATAQVVDLLLRQILQPNQLPRLVLWADGSRAFNSGRPDATYKGIAASKGYQRLLLGERPIRSLSFQLESLPSRSWIPTFCSSPDHNFIRFMDRSSCYLAPFLPQPATPQQPVPQQSVLPSPIASPTPSDLDTTGFQSVLIRFNPVTYYRQFPRVSGRYDSNYANFRLNGEQTTAAIAIATFLRARQIPLVFVNLPLSQEYLDPIRSAYERQFQRHMYQLASREGFVFRDLMRQWPTQNDYFADPSHLNRYGAHAVSQRLAVDRAIAWPTSLSIDLPDSP